MTETEWTFESNICHPDGIRVQITITVPCRAAWKDVGEAGEVAQMTAWRAMEQLKSCRERPPF